MQKTLILCPTLNDEEAFNHFIKRLEDLAASLKDRSCTVLIVNDGGRQPIVSTKLPYMILNLYRNIGHQKAIAVGLSYACENIPFDEIVIMDGDGEDNPADLPMLLNLKDKDDAPIVAVRASRQEGMHFKLFYRLYKIAFRALTGKNIAFGNFMVLPKKEASRLVHYHELWSHLAGTLIRSKMAFKTVPLHRGKRYAGHSKMNFTSLLLHGFNALAVFLDRIAVRLLLFSLVLIGIAVFGFAFVLIIKTFTDLAIPGWATTVSSAMLIVLLQGFLLSLFTVFLYLSSAGQRNVVPARHYSDHIESVKHGHH